ncbi:MDR family MFS transporter [Alkalihalobacillus sp. CinArs1]|uniref:MDR family MFS transporter n=1 Tax=Alkalihalobacillus sp. CinArs1 TaxID=2995314 RepID=UPI0022DD130E|nr:MFS transporter [Alkalihalobacillus sp. CinArs1]
MSFKNLHYNIKIRIVTQFFTTFATMMVMPFLTVYFAQKVGQTVTGFMLVSLVFIGVAGGMIGGYFSDRIGRKRLMVGSELGTGIAFFIIAFLNSPWLDAPYLTYAVFIFSMFFGGVLGPVSQAMVLDVTNSENRRYVFTLLYWIGNMSSGIAGIIGAIFFYDYLFHLFLVIAIVSFLSALITQLFITESYIIDSSKAETTNKGSILNNYKIVFRDRVFMMFFIAGILVLSLEEQLTNFLAIHFADEITSQSLISFREWNVDVDGVLMLGILRSENTFLVVFAAGLITWLVKRWSNRTVLMVGLSIYSIGYALFTMFQLPWVLIAVMVVVTIGELMYIPVRQAMLGDLAPDHARSSYLAIHQMVFYIAMLVAAVDIIIGGFVPPWMMGLKYVLFGGVGMLLFLKVDKRIEEKKVEKAYESKEKAAIQ